MEDENSSTQILDIDSLFEKPLANTNNIAQEEIKIWGRLLNVNFQSIGANVPSSVDLVEDEYWIGRGRDSAIKIQENHVSSKHCRLYMTRKSANIQAYIEDQRYLISFCS